MADDALRQKALKYLDDPEASDEQKDAAREILRRLEGDKEVQFEDGLAAKEEAATDPAADPSLAPPPFEGDPESAKSPDGLDEIRARYAVDESGGVRQPAPDQTSEYHNQIFKPEEERHSPVADWANLHGHHTSGEWLPEGMAGMMSGEGPADAMMAISSLLSGNVQPAVSMGKAALDAVGIGSPTHEIDGMKPEYASGSRYRDLENTLSGEMEERADRSPGADITAIGTSMIPAIAMPAVGGAELTAAQMAARQIPLAMGGGAVTGLGSSEHDVLGVEDQLSLPRFLADGVEGGLTSAALATAIGGGMGLAQKGGDIRLDGIQGQYSAQSPAAHRMAFSSGAKPSLFARGGVTKPPWARDLEKSLKVQAKKLGAGGDGSAHLTNPDSYTAELVLPALQRAMIEDTTGTVGRVGAWNKAGYAEPGMRKRVSLEELGDDIGDMIDELSDPVTGPLPGSGIDQWHKFMRQSALETEEMPLVEAIRIQQKSGNAGRVVPVGVRPAAEEVVDEAVDASGRTIPGGRGDATNPGRKSPVVDSDATNPGRKSPVVDEDGTNPGRRSPSKEKENIYARADVEEVEEVNPYLQAERSQRAAEDLAKAAREKSSTAAAEKAANTPMAKVVYPAHVTSAKQLDDYKRMVDRQRDSAGKRGDSAKEVILDRISGKLKEIRDREFGRVSVKSLVGEHHSFDTDPAGVWKFTGPSWREIKRAEEMELSALNHRMEAMTGSPDTQKILWGVFGKQADRQRNILKGYGAGSSADMVIEGYGGAAALGAQRIAQSKALEHVRRGGESNLYMGTGGRGTMHASATKILNRLTGLSRLPRTLAATAAGALAASNLSKEEAFVLESLAEQVGLWEEGAADMSDQVAEKVTGFFTDLFGSDRKVDEAN